MRVGDHVRKRDGSRWGWRRIRFGGRVRWLGRWYVVASGLLNIDEYKALALSERAHHENCPKYDGRMDEHRALFYAYGRQWPELANNIYLHSFEGHPWPGLDCVEGVFHWSTFARVAQ